MKQKYTILNLNFLSGTKLPKITPEEVIANDNIILRFTDPDLYNQAINNPDLANHTIIGPEHRTCDCICDCKRIAMPDSDLCSLCGPSIHGESKPKGPGNIVIKEGWPDCITDITGFVKRKLKGWLP